jgi:general secretion pathway protein E
VVKGQLFRGGGCDHCLKTGYFGRTGIFESLVMDDDIRELVMKRTSAHIIKETAVRKGMMTLHEDGLRLALAGQTTLEEIYRVTQDRVQTEQG